MEIVNFINNKISRITNENMNVYEFSIHIIHKNDKETLLATELKENMFNNDSDVIYLKYTDKSLCHVNVCKDFTYSIDKIKRELNLEKTILKLHQHIVAVEDKISILAELMDKITSDNTDSITPKF